MTTSSTFKPEFEGHIERCYFCNGAWGECKCTFPSTCIDDPNAPGFDWNEFWITQPNVSVCTRFFVNPVVYYGEAYISSDLCKSKAI